MTISGKTRFYSFWPIFWCFKTMRNLVCFLIVHLKNQLLLPAFGTKMTHFFGVFCYEPPGKWSKKWSKKWSFLTLFLTRFWTTFWPHYLCVSYSTRHLRAYLGGTWNMVQKGVQKVAQNLTTRIFRKNWVIFHLFWRPRPSDHLELQKVVKKGSKNGSKSGHF